MQIEPYPLALRTTLAAWDLERETGRVSEADYQMDCAQAIAASKLRLIAKGKIDASWADTGPDGGTPIPFADNPDGLTMIFYKAEQL